MNLTVSSFGFHSHEKHGLFGKPELDFQSIRKRKFSSTHTYIGRVLRKRSGVFDPHFFDGPDSIYSELLIRVLLEGYIQNNPIMRRFCFLKRHCLYIIGAHQKAFGTVTLYTKAGTGRTRNNSFTGREDHYQE